MKVLVIGGGIGGLSATLALRRQGFDVDVVERDPEWGVYGVGIIQPGNALRALDSLGLAEACVEAGAPIRGDRTWLADGKTPIAAHEWPALVEHLPPGNGLTRPKLHEILTSRTLASGTDVRTGVTFTEIDPSGDHVDVAFTDGERRQYDLVIGADGLYSNVRERLFASERGPRFTGQVCWRYNLPRLDGLEEIWMFFGPNGSAGFVPLGEDLMYILTIETPIPTSEPRSSGTVRLACTGSVWRPSPVRSPMCASRSSTTTRSWCGRSRTSSRPRHGIEAGSC